MQWSWGHRAMRGATRLVARPGVLAAAACALALAACNQNGDATMSAAQPRGATVAFDSIDGPPAEQFQTLVRDLNDEAQARRLAVLSRESPSAYRVRGYLAANVEEGRTTISWAWDVFDRDERRAFRITGEETSNGRHGWTAADDAMLHRIARSSMDQLAAFLTSPEVAPGTPAPAGGPQLALVGQSEVTPESAGIFRISHANVDPVSGATTAAPQAAADVVPLPHRRPAPAAAISARETLTLSAASHY